MKQIYSCCKPVQLFVIFLFFLGQNSQNIYGQCSFCSDELPDGIIQSCDNFEAYTANRVLPSNTRWRGWGNNSDFPTVQVVNNSKVINMTYSSGSSDPDILYRLGNKNSSRFRLSWNMFMNPNKEGNFVILHNSESQIFRNNTEENEAYSVDFKKTGKAYLAIAGKIKQDSFSYKLNAWNRIMQIIDLDQNRVELWVNGQFIRKWTFNLGSLSLSKNLGSLSFWTQSNSNYSFYVDNICYWERNFCNTGIAFDPVCIQNGETYRTSRGAGCTGLYTLQEYTSGNCERICDYARRFAYVDAPLEAGKLNNQSVPLSVQQTSCVYDFFGYVGPKKLYGDVFAIKLRGGNYSIAWKTPKGKKSKAFLFSCSCAGVICTQDCIPEDDFDLPYTAVTGEQVVKYNVEKSGFYYVAIIGEEALDYTNFNVTTCPPDGLRDPNLPELRTPNETSGCGPCQTLNPIVLTGDTTLVGNLTGEGNNFSESSQAYENCNATSTRLYDGEDIVLKFVLDKPKVMSLSVICASPIGVFLYGSECGNGCLDVAESGDAGGTASMAPIALTAGAHYVIIDKNTKFGQGSNQFTLSLRFQDLSSSDFVSDDSNCPKETLNPHQVRIRAVGALLLSELSLDKKDRISFVYDKGQNNYQLAQGQYWNGIELVYNFFADKSGDALKCSYAPNDSFEIRIVKEGQIYYVKPTFNAGAEQVFKPGAQSVINGFTKTSISSFNIDTSPRKMSALKGNVAAIALATSTNSPWTISNIPNWLKVEPSSGVGSQDILITSTSDNPNNQVRKANLRITNTENFLRTLSIEQKACTAASVDIDSAVQVCAGDVLVLKPLSVKGAYKWGNNSTASTFTVNTSTPGTNKFFITATSGTCTAKDSVIVTVKAKPVFDLGPDKTICLGDSVLLTASGGGEYQWSQSNATTASISIKPASNSTYSVTVTKNVCQASDQISVKVNPKPIANAGPDQNICSGGKTVLSASGVGTYSWSNGSTAAQFEVNPSTTTTYTLTVTSEFGCTATDQVVVVVNRANANAGTDRSICRGNSTVLQASGGGTYLWSSGETTTSITVSPDADKVYQVTVNNNNCTASASVKVTVIPLPQASAGLPQTICRGQTTTLSASGGGSYLWNTGASTQQVTVSPTQSTDFTVTVTQNGCANTSGVRVTVIAVTANAGPDQSICAGQSTVLNGIGGGTYKWSQNNATTPSINVSPTATQTYTLKVTQGNCSATDEVIVKVNPNPVIVEESIRPAAGPTGNIQVKVSGGTPGYKYQWFRNDTLVFTQEDLVGLKTAVYKLIVSDANGCTATYGPKLITKSEVILSLTELEVFPNPSDGAISIKGKLNTPEIIEVYILDANGRRIWKSQQDKLSYFEHNLNLQSLAKGIYLIQIKVSGYSSFKKIILL